MTPIFKSEEKTDKKNYRPVSILNSLSKVFENVMKEQLIPFLQKLRLIESWRRCLDQSQN